MVKEAQKGRPPQKGSLSEGWLPAQSMDAMIPDTYGSATFNKYKLYVRLPSVELLMKTEFFWKSYRDLITLEKAAFFTQKGSWPDVGPYVVRSLWERAQGTGCTLPTRRATALGLPGHSQCPCDALRGIVQVLDLVVLWVVRQRGSQGRPARCVGAVRRLTPSSSANSGWRAMRLASKVITSRCHSRSPCSSNLVVKYRSPCEVEGYLLFILPATRRQCHSTARTSTPKVSSDVLNCPEMVCTPHHTAGRGGGAGAPAMAQRRECSEVAARRERMP